jgi:hypothetical protein
MRAPALSSLDHAIARWKKVGYDTVLIGPGESKVWDYKAFYVKSATGARYPFDVAAMAQRIAELARTNHDTDTSAMYALELRRPRAGEVEFSLVTERGNLMPIELKGRIVGTRVYVMHIKQDAGVDYAW